MSSMLYRPPPAWQRQGVPWYVICSTCFIKKISMNKALVDRRELSATSERELSRNVFLVAPGVWRMKDLFVNVFIIQNRDATDWVLVDAGLKTSAPKIKAMAAELFGSRGSRPTAIVMTHAHFDHRGYKLRSDGPCIRAYSSDLFGTKESFKKSEPTKIRARLMSSVF